MPAKQPRSQGPLLPGPSRRGPWERGCQSNAVMRRCCFILFLFVFLFHQFKTFLKWKPCSHFRRVLYNLSFSGQILGGLLSWEVSYYYINIIVLLIGTLRNHDGNENVARKHEFALLVLLCNYSNSFNLYNVDELSSNRTCGKGIQVETENKKITVMWSRSPQNLQFVMLRCCLAEHGEEMYRNLHVKRTCKAFVFLSISYCFVRFSLQSP